MLALAFGAAAQGSVAITAGTVPEIQMLETNGPGNAVSAAFSPDGKLLAVATTAGVKLYEVALFGVDASGGDLLDGGGFPANGLAFRADGTQLVASAMGYNVRAFDVETGALVADEYPDDLDGSLNAVALDPAGETVALAAGDAMNVYEWETRERRFQALGHTGVITQVAYSPDGAKIATASGDGTARVWDAGDGGFLVALEGHTERVSSVSWTADGAELFTASEDGTVRRWNAATGEALGTVYTHDGGGPMVAALNPQGHLIVGDHHGDLTFISGDNLEFTGTLGTQRGEIRAVAFSPDGRLAASVSAEEVVLYDVAVVSAIGVIPFQGGYTALALSADGSQFATGSADGSLEIVSVGDDAPVYTYSIGTPVTALAFAPDAILYVGSENTSVAAIDMHNSAALESFPGTAAVNAVALHPTRPLLNAAMADNALRWWSTETREEFGTDTSHEAPATASAFSPDGLYMASADANGVIYVWEVENGGWLYIVEGAGAQINDLAFSADSSMLAAALADGRALLWQTGDPTTPAHTLADFFGAVNAVAFSPDMAILAAASNDGTLQLYDTATGAALTKFYDHNAPVYGVAFSPDGTRIYSAGGDGLVRTWGIP
jgi:WD40 repeat protein